MHPVVQTRNLPIILGSLFCLTFTFSASTSLFFVPSNCIMNQSSIFYIYCQCGGPSLLTKFHLHFQSLSPQPSHHTANRSSFKIKIARVPTPFNLSNGLSMHFMLYIKYIFHILPLFQSFIKV